MKERAAKTKDRILSDETQDRILSDVSKALYGFNLTIDLVDGSFLLIPGNGVEWAREALEGAKDYREAYERNMKRIRPEYHDALRQLGSFDYLRLNYNRSGVLRTEQYQTVGDEETSRWREVNVTYGTGANGHPVANILARDITALRQGAARRERELTAAAAEDRTLAGLVKELYGFDVTVNLADSFSLIRGTGAENICAAFESCLGHPYSEAMDVFVSHVPEEHKAKAYGILSRDVLQSLTRKHGRIDTRAIPWHGPDGGDCLCEITAFMSQNEAREPIVNLLGRTVPGKVPR